MPLLETLFPLGIAQYLTGGLIIGLALGFLYLATGLVGGMNTFYSSTWSFVSNWSFFQQERFIETRQWRLFYAAGLIIGAAVWLYRARSLSQDQRTRWHSHPTADENMFDSLFWLAGGFTADQPRTLGDIVHTVYIGLRQQAAVGVIGQATIAIQCTVAHHVLAFTLTTKAETFQLHNNF